VGEFPVKVERADLHEGDACLHAPVRFPIEAHSLGTPIHAARAHWVIRLGLGLTESP